MNVGDIIKDKSLFGPNFNFYSSGSSGTVGNLLSALFPIAIFIAAFLSFYWLVWGAFHYMIGGASKETLQKARARITWAIVGLLLTLTAILVAQFAAQILPPFDKPGTTPII